MDVSVLKAQTRVLRLEDEKHLFQGCTFWNLAATSLFICQHLGTLRSEERQAFFHPGMRQWYPKAVCDPWTSCCAPQPHLNIRSCLVLNQTHWTVLLIQGSSQSPESLTGDDGD